MTLNRRLLMTSLAALPLAGGAAVAATPPNGDYWCVTCIDNGHAILQVEDEADFQKHKHYIDNNECGMCGSQFFKGDMTHFRSGWRYAPIGGPEDERKLLTDTRNALLPKLAAYAVKPLEFDIAVDFKTRNLIVSGYNHDANVKLGFCITNLVIRDGRRLDAMFAPAMTLLVESLTTRRGDWLDKPAVVKAEGTPVPLRVFRS